MRKAINIWYKISELKKVPLDLFHQTLIDCSEWVLENCTILHNKVNTRATTNFIEEVNLKST